MFGLAAFLVFLAFALSGYAISSWVRSRGEAHQKVVNRLDSMVGKGRAALPGSLLRDQRLSHIAFLNALLGRIPTVVFVARMIRQAGLRKRVGEVLLYIPLLAIAALLINQLAGGPLLIGVILAVVAGSLPLLVVQRMRHKRTLRFAEQLPEALDLIRAALQAGHGLPSAMTVTASTFPDPISYELGYLVEEMRVGLPMRDALHHLADRVPDPNVPIMAVGLLVAQESGGNLAEVIANLAHTIRERFKLRREVGVFTAQGRLSGLVLTVLPFIVGVAMYFTSPTYFTPILTTRTGHFMLAYVLVSILCGHLVIRRLVTPKF